jgi:type II secretory pathway pseudopilin PulG
MAIKEKTLNREAKANLALIRAAEKIYRMEQGFYYPQTGEETTISVINSFLKLSLPDSASVSWDITVRGDAAGENAEALRSGGSGADGRIWSIDFPGETEPSCSGGSYCPP